MDIEDWIEDLKNTKQDNHSTMFKSEVIDWIGDNALPIY